ncbi:glycosyltransferase family 2 protein [Paenibacillus sp. sgz500958]|uniref:glycosyltransferase family 2 protein n=1 Tax=Paenibacillus sp. sgz500958 TaxID=3242475 RepID=UPI0036D3D9E4
MARVSILMPVYNVESFIEEEIYSILQQTYRDFELVIIDDGSTDTTALAWAHKILNANWRAQKYNQEILNTVLSQCFKYSEQLLQ